MCRLKLVKILFLFASITCLAQQRVPFVGCPADGQAGPVPAPRNGTISLPVSKRAAQQLAYYSTDRTGGGVLAPRGWQCLLTYGSSGSRLLVTPQKVVWPPGEFPKFSGPAVVLDETGGQGSGRNQVAEIIGRMFPAFFDYARKVERDWDAIITYAPFPNDTLTRKSDRVVEYRTPPGTEGLGTLFPMVQGSLPVHGIALIEGNVDYLTRLHARLPAALEDLAPEIVSQAERESHGH